MNRIYVNDCSVNINMINTGTAPLRQPKAEKYGLWDAPVTVTGVPWKLQKPITSFEHGMFSPKIQQNRHFSKYKRFTPIQQYSLPVIKLRRDAIGCAPTGTGKTIAYLLPVIDYLEKNAVWISENNQVFPSALVIVPTRELAIQIFEETKLLCQGTKVRPGVAYGGVAFADTCSALREGCHLLVATPGRLKALLESAVVSLKRCETLVLDEADRMLEMGFEYDVREIVDFYDLPMKGRRQTLMFSATFPQREQELAADFMHDYAFIAVGSIGAANQDILQEVLKVHESEKLDTLKGVVRRCCADHGSSNYKILVFVQTKTTAEWLSTRFRNSDTINGNMAQEDRDIALSNFKSGRINILFATDVASRGLDIPNVDLVVNADLPRSIAAYVQRIGRTGRVGRKGHAISFYDNCNPIDTYLLKDLLTCLANAHQYVPGWLLREAGHAPSIEVYINHTREEDAWNY